MAGESLNGKVALRLFFMIVGTLFIWEAVPSSRWTSSMSPNIQTGLWQTCSCGVVDRSSNDHCKIPYSDMQESYFWTKFQCDDSNSTCKDKNSPYNNMKKQLEQTQYLFRDLKKEFRGNEGRSKDGRLHHHHHGDPLWTPSQFNALWNSTEQVYEAQTKQCREYKGAGAIALISYIFAFIAFLLVIKNIASNKAGMDFGVYICVLMCGIWGLIATAMFGDLFGKNEGRFPLGHQFAIFTTAWCLFFVVGTIGLSDMRKGVSASETASAVRSVLFVSALVGFAYSMGEDWFVQDQQDLIVPLGGFQWTVKASTFFIAPALYAPYITSEGLLHFSVQGRNFNGKSAPSGDRIGARYCEDYDPETDFWNATNPEFVNTHLFNQKSYSVYDHLVGNRNGYVTESVEDSDGDRKRDGREDLAGDGERRWQKDHHLSNIVSQQREKNDTHIRNHYNDQCILPARPTIVRGSHVVGLYKNCYCKTTTSLTCDLFGSEWPMLNGRDVKCQTFNVARAMILMVGIFAFIALSLSSILIGGLRRKSIHLLSNTFCMLAALLGLISSILYGGVVYNVKNLATDFGMYVAGWWLLFFAFILGGAVSNYYDEVTESAKVTPMNELQTSA